MTVVWMEQWPQQSKNVGHKVACDIGGKPDWPVIIEDVLEVHGKIYVWFTSA